MIRASKASYLDLRSMTAVAPTVGYHEYKTSVINSGTPHECSYSWNRSKIMYGASTPATVHTVFLKYRVNVYKAHWGTQ